MTPTDIAAYIGAAAWFPQIGKWIYDAWARPMLRIVPAQMVMLAYNNLGPTVQLTASLSTERRDALIEGASLEISHEMGEKRHLVWVMVSEFGQQITVPTGEVMNFGRNLPATAIKLTRDTLADRQIVLQDPDFAKTARTLSDQVFEHYRFLKTRDEDPMKALLQSKEIRPAREYFERSFYWKPGRYIFDILLKSPALRSGHVQKFEVVLSTPDSDLLASNCKLFDEYVTAAILSAEGVPSKFPTWKIASAAIREI
jgi:hypothetical protein